MISLREFPEFMMMLGEPLGWDPQLYRDNKDMMDDFLEELHIPTYNWFRHLNFWDVL